MDTLRVFVNVPQLHASAIRVGMRAPSRCANSYGTDIFDGAVARTSNEIDGASRSLLTEVDIPNPDGALLAGMYARVKLDVEEADRPLLVPSTAVLFDAQGTRAAVIDGGVVHWKAVDIEGDLGDHLAIARGSPRATSSRSWPASSSPKGCASGRTTETCDRPEAERRAQGTGRQP